LLIFELNKPGKSDIFKKGKNKNLVRIISHKKSSKVNKSPLINYYEEEDMKDNLLIYYLLKNIHGFIKYLKFNGIEDDVLKETIPFIKHKTYEQGEYIFQEGDYCESFYGILKGKVSIRKTKFEKLQTNTNLDTSILYIK
jgi:hypothetical protein